MLPSARQIQQTLRFSPSLGKLRRYWLNEKSDTVLPKDQQGFALSTIVLIMNNPTQTTTMKTENGFAS